MTSDVHRTQPTTRGVLLWLALFAIAVAFAWTLLIVVAVGMFLLT